MSLFSACITNRFRYDLFLLAITFVLTACGGGGNGDSSTDVTLSPVNPNTIPVINIANPDQTATSGIEFNYDATQNDTTFSDADGDSLSYSVSYAPSDNGLSDTNGTITGTPSATGDFTVTITADDGNGGSVSDAFVITINEPNPTNPNPSTNPNILFILSDDQGLDASAQYSVSTDLPTTPTLNALAADGLIFDNAWVYPICTPTRAGLITGRYGVHTGVTELGISLPITETVLHSYLANDANTSTYNSALIGKWHLGGGNNAPNNFGIDHFAGITGGGVNDYFSWALNINGTSSTVTNYTTTELTDQAIAWIDQQSEPWFVWLAYNAPHTPFHLPPNNLHTQNLSGTTADIAANPRDYYLAAIEAMDSEIGRLLSNLTQAERDNTIIIYLGDNGTPGQVVDSSAYPNGAKGSLTEGGIRVPMFVSGAGVSRQGERETTLVNNTDLFSTIVEIAGGTTPTLPDSDSFAEFFSNPAATGQDYVYTEATDINAPGWTIRNDQYKLIEFTNGSQELFDLNTDPMENTNLLTSGTDVTAIVDELKTAGDAIRQ